MGPRRSAQPVGAVVLVALLLSACGGAAAPDAAGSASPSASGTSAASPEATAELGVIDTEVAVRAAGVGEFATGADGAALAIGDTVRTDPVGFGEIRYEDGSLTRVDVDSEATVLALGEVGTPQVEVSLEVGRVWNRVRDLGDAGSFEVTTDVATAAVRGTAFEVDCRAVLAGACLFVVYEGTVEVTPTDGEPVVLQGFAYLLVASDGTVDEQGAVAPDLTTPDAVDGDWVRRNDDLDQGGGAAALELAEEPSPLVLGAIYQCSTIDDATTFYRFFEGGEVISVVSTGTAAQIEPWFLPPSEDPDFDDSVGSYTLVDGAIRGSTVSQFEETSGNTVAFDGTVADDGSITWDTEASNGFTSTETCVPTGFGSA